MVETSSVSAISESFTLASLGRISRRNSSGSKTAPGLAFVPLRQRPLANRDSGTAPSPDLGLQPG
jgi:hypothetical protein